jgi:RHS repeat-associated protein
MEIGGTFFRVQLGLLISLVLGMGLLLPGTGQAACTAFDQNSGEHCTAIKFTPWRWQNYRYSGLGLFPSLESLTSAVIARRMSVVHPVPCSFTHTSTTDRYPPFLALPNAPETVTAVYPTLNFIDVWTNTAPCNVTQSAYADTLGQRTLYCPANYTLVYQDSPRIGPYCAIPWWKMDEGKAAGCGDCKTGQIRKGNPIDVGSGNKYQRETDYVGTRHHPLRVERHYNSILIKNYAPTAFVFEPFGPGWSAQYFQRVAQTISGNQATALVYRPDGQILTFNLSGSTFVAPPDVVERLVAQRNGAGEVTGWTLRTRQDDVESYDANGKLLSIQYRDGATHVLEYDTAGLLKFVTEDGGRRLQVSFDSKQRVSTVLDPAGVAITYGYAANNTLTGVTYQDATTKQYHYGGVPSGGGSYYLTGVTDENASRYSTFGYGYWGNAETTELAGAVNKYIVSGTTVTDPLGKQRTYGIPSLMTLHIPRVTSSSAYCPGCGEDKATTYDANANVSRRTDFNNVETRYTYELARNLETSRTEAYGTARARTVTTTWHATLRLPTQIDETGRRTTYTHDTAGNVLTKTVADLAAGVSRTWTYTYNAVGQVLTADGPRTDVADVTTYTYYSCTTGFQCGQLHTVTNAASHVTTYGSYNAHGQPLSITDPNGIVTTLTYDARQRLKTRTVAGEATSFDYWSTGLLKKVTQPDGSYLSYSYDAAHRLTGIADAEGNRIAYTLDNMGNRTKEEMFDPSNALASTRSRVFNTLNQLNKELGAAGTAAVTTTFSYDTNGNMTSIAAPLSRNTSQAYDELSRMKQVTDPASGVTSYGYDALDQLISVTDPRGKITSYTYNALGDVTQQVSPDTGTTSSTYDSGGNLQTRTDARGKTGTYTYDALNRVTALSYPDQTITLTHDQGTNGAGRLTSVTDGSGSTAWTYDAQGRVLTRQQVMSGVSKSISYSYNTSGQLQSWTLPSGNTISVGYADGKATSLTLNGSTTILSNALYRPFGSTLGWTWGNSTLAVREYDTDGKVTDVDSAGLKTYSYDDAFRITGIVDGSNSALSQAYGYDNLDRLTSATGTALNQAWTYDANGNRLSQGGAASSTYVVSSTSNRLSSVSGAVTRAYSYDLAGNTVADGAATFTYDDSGRMVSATKGGVTAAYKHNALGQRVRKTIGSVNTYFAYDEAGRLVGEYGNGGALIQETVWFDDAPVVTLRPNTGGGVDAFYIHSDQLNTPRRISRPSDNVIVWRWDSEPFGATPSNSDPDGDGNLFDYPLRFPGQYADTDTGLNYNYFRDYDPVTGRYVESDPIGLEGGIDTYTYVLGNPINSYDPDGRETIALPRFPIPPIPPPNPVVAAGAVAVGAGLLINVGFERFYGDSIGGAIYDATHSDPMEMTAPGNVADTQVVQDYNTYASWERLCGRTPLDRCAWLEKNKGKYRQDQVTATQKAWGCRRNRAKK